MINILPKRKSWLCRCIAALCCIAILSGTTVFAEPENGSVAALSEETSMSMPSEDAYRSYREKHAGKPVGLGELIIKATDFTLTASESKLPEYKDRQGVLMLSDTAGSATCSFTVEADGLYRIAADYFPVETGGLLEPTLSFKIDGKRPFEEADTVYLPKIFANETEIKRDTAGNDLRPRQIERPHWREADFIDNTGFNADPFLLYLTAGVHELTIEITQEAVAIHSLRIYHSVSRSYAEVHEEYKDKGYKQAGGEIKIIQGEAAFEKTDPTICPESGSYSANALLEPSSPYNTRLNVLSYGKPGQFATWKITAEESGLYNIGLRLLQDGHRGVSAIRGLKIDGELPFTEASAIEIPYASKWSNVVLGGDTPYLFYFEAGREYDLTLEVATGERAKTLGFLQDTVKEMSIINRRITSVVGLTPDAYRDYRLDVEIPDLISSLKSVKAQLENAINTFDSSLRDKGTALVTLENIIRDIGELVDSPRNIPSRISNFRVSVSNLSEWILGMTAQWVAIDTIVLLPGSTSMPRASAGFFEQLVFEIKAIVGSFFRDYSSVGGQGGTDPVTVWVTGGRDQANIIRQQIDDSFVFESGIPVLLSLVGDTATLLQATLGGKGPDVALFTEKNLAVNLAARGALVELSGFPEFYEIEKRFYPSAMIPYKFNGGVYALPNSQGFSLMFCRTDILNELGLAIPNTWDEFYKSLPVIQRNNMQVGMVADINIFETLLLQRGGQLYRDDLQATALDSIAALEAFKMWTGLYAEYSLPMTYDAFSYFRSGAIPIMIADYTQYNLLSIAAPEIRGLWEMAPIPGTVQADGSINRREGSSGSAGIIMKSASNHTNAFAFLDWWTKESTQTRFSLDLEATIGLGARYNSANKETVGKLAWKKSEYSAISAMWEQVWDFPVLPSSYYISRNFINAFRAVVYKKENPREALNKYAAIIDKEITRKNKEIGFGEAAADE